MDFERFSALVPDGVTVKPGEPLSAHTGFRTGGSCSMMLFPHDADSLAACVRLARECGVPHYILGNGSNVLAGDGGYEGAVICTGRVNGLSFSGDRVSCGAGTALSVLANECAERSLSGLEFAHGIPGTVGGAVFMNAGAYGGEIKDVLLSAEVFCADGVVRTLTAEQLCLGYRTSALSSSGGVLLGATFGLKAGERDEIRAAMGRFMQRRREKQPLELPSCGSTFKRPEGAYAAELIDRCGLKGFAVGGAAVSDKHAGFVVNTGGATSADVLSVIERVKSTVKQKTGYELEPEVRFLGVASDA